MRFPDIEIHRPRPLRTHGAPSFSAWARPACLARGILPEAVSHFAVADTRDVPPEIDTFKQEFPDVPLALGGFPARANG